MQENKNLSTIVHEINETLRSYGKAAVQEVKMSKDGKVIGQIRYGYRPQFVFDAVNAVLLPEKWRYEIISKEIFNQQAVVEVKLFIRIGDQWLCKGSQIGQMQIIKENIGDAYKGAVTDAIQKCLSLLSIGTDAYRGLLESVYKGLSQPIASNRQPVQPAVLPETPASTSSQHQKSQASQDNQDLPQITGVQIKRVEDRFVARGKVFEKKEILKAAGFKFDGANRTWFKDATAAVH